MKFTTETPNLYNKLLDFNNKLERVQRELEKYLDKKREKFARFYFLANDELLEILSKASNAPLIVDHLKNMFENIYNLLLEGDK